MMELVGSDGYILLVKPATAWRLKGSRVYIAHWSICYVESRPLQCSREPIVITCQAVGGIPEYLPVYHAQRSLRINEANQH